MAYQMAISIVDRPCTPTQRAGRLNIHEINSLRHRSAEVAMRVPNPCEQIAAFLSQLAQDILLLFTPQSKQSSMCKFYGHVIHNNNWKGHLPKCGDCGQVISSADQLRSSDPTRAARKQEEPSVEQVYKSRIKW